MSLAGSVLSLSPVAFFITQLYSISAPGGKLAFLVSHIQLVPTRLAGVKSGLMVVVTTAVVTFLIL